MLELKVDGEVGRRLRQSAMDILGEVEAVAGTGEPDVDAMALVVVSFARVRPGLLSSIEIHEFYIPSTDTGMNFCTR